MNKLPEQFLTKFIRKNMQERVEHEWRKKPEKLHYRICHKASELFEDKFKNKHVKFDQNEMCYFLQGRSTKFLSFSEVEPMLNSGCGILIVDVSGSKFYAETESEKGHPFEFYAGS